LKQIAIFYLWFQEDAVIFLGLLNVPTNNALPQKRHKIPINLPISARNQASHISRAQNPKNPTYKLIVLEITPIYCTTQNPPTPVH